MKQSWTSSTRSTSATASCCLLIIILVTACRDRMRYPLPPIEGEQIVIQTASLPMEVPQFYSYRADSGHVDFFVIRMHDRVLSFLDACITCYPRKLGYRSENGSVVCRACDTRYSIYKLEKGVGGCFPIRVEGRSENGRYLIARSVLDRHTGKF